LGKNIKNIRNCYPGLFILFIIFIISSCHPTKYVPSGETLLDENNISINKEGIKKSDLIPYIKQNPNKRIFGTRFHLGLYNLSNINKTRWPHKWLRDIGEEPVIFDEYSAVKSKNQIKSYVASKGYFDARVTDTIETASRKSKVYYNVDLSPPYTIRNLAYEIADSNIKKLVSHDEVNCLIVKGNSYDVDVLQAERSRLERFIKDRGFYAFSSDNMSFRIDSTVGNRQVDIYFVIKNLSKVDSYNRTSSPSYSIYFIKDIYIYPDFVPREALEKGAAYYESLDTINYRGYNFITSAATQEVKYDLILQTLYLKPGSVYNVSNTEETRSHLLGLKTYRLVNIFYDDYNGPADTTDKVMLLNCNIQLTLLSQQSYKVELEGTNTGGYLGGALNLIYQHKNLFHGAELFSMKLKGAYEALRQDSNKLSSTQEYAAETSLRFPKFILPFVNTEDFIKKYNPSTQLLAAYNYQDMPFYVRTIATANFGYNWKAGLYQEHIVNPLQLNLVNLIKIDSAFQSRIDASSYQVNSYKDVLIFGGTYSFIYTDQKIKKSKDYWFLRINAEAAGNLLSMAGKITNADTVNGSYQIFGQPFAQYVRADFDLRYNYVFNDYSSVVYRGYFGIGIPYGNSLAIPFEKQYFSGGSNGIRAWQVRTLGPGSYNAGEVFLNQTGDIKLEANVEYRFKLFWILEGAVFLDAGNIWTYRDDPSRPGSQFIINKFYKDIAVGTGAGIRFDLKFVIARVDAGMKLRDPLLPDGAKWIVQNHPYSLRRYPGDFTLVLGIGYPF
jgi:outer membrane protein assembly factor BamA